MNELKETNIDGIVFVIDQMQYKQLVFAELKFNDCLIHSVYIILAITALLN